jgi:hypothetical protein
MTPMVIAARWDQPILELCRIEANKMGALVRDKVIAICSLIGLVSNGMRVAWLSQDIHRCRMRSAGLLLGHCNFATRQAAGVAHQIACF